ncbi:tRNA (adenosine(37)-N6)-threonylcarbamoyltransferase complex dimerization subunit type 1 TsaB [Sphingosinicella microcystinivorans]|uniref:tRNA (Adenosine(37)-N6)-threonylcarbamoyltransferase complex dimerization subunit type 1 TsaB n=1 Tax=Sphingosinicella microcystinivorans TaxID=335406 RepID=A0AAD1D399_SPHMI|nr:tRNA (adenosine(37)-N6)-threonylcarbamoyltransferase complex dimerization subunit type 1 TsaB [Sphingosinicella microcystinivorans]RKS89235.1 tRNA threonylcarbamoyl adenosine modification protein YeaZ [Sphingosinicella microcystinivorans]BBE32993.1 tRNA (adenosine(37)-N6)-threonylcarbamoyltransferase complex dimerization subunit type 1 TsaB [Sphingosinicella microcystinivorans]
MLLAIETGTAACSVALIDGTTIVAARHEIIGRGHAERLVPLVEAVLAEAGRRPRAIAVDVGPGSFTGLRVGIAAARGFGLVWAVPVYGYSSTALIAASALAAHDMAPLTIVMDAGRGEVFVQTFDRNLKPAAPAAALSIAAAAAEYEGALAGTGAALLRDAGSTAVILSETPPDARDVRLLAPELRSLPPTPLYVRAPDAKLPA